MKKTDNGTFPFYTFRNLSQVKEIIHFVSSGVKNIGFTDGTDARLIADNRRVLATAVGYEPEQLTTAGQVHSDCITIVTADMVGKGALDKDSRIPNTDALVTDCKGICLMVMSADCVPILLYEPHRRIIAAVHAGWRGTIAGIGEQTVGLMVKEFNCNPALILAGIGPSIGSCCFEVGEEVALAFGRKYPEVIEGSRCRQADKYQVDLWQANKQGLLAAGVLPENIEVAGNCSVCSSEHFFSYRRDGDAAGRFGAGIMLKE